MKFARIKTLLFTLSFFFVGSAYAIDVQFNKFTQNLSYESLEDALLVNPHTGTRDTFGFSLGYSFVEDPLGRGKRRTTLTPVLSDLHSIQFGLNLALAKRLELLTYSAIHFYQNNLSGDDGTSWGDTTLAVKYRLLKTQSDFAIALMPYVIFPTGDQDKFLGGENAGYGGMLALEKNFRHFGTVVNLGYTFTSHNVERNIDYSHLYHLGLGARIPIYRFAIQTEYRINFTNDSNEQRPNEFHLGGSYQISDSLRAFASLGFGNIEFENNNDYRMLVGIKGSFGKRAKEKPTPVVIEEPVEETPVEVIEESPEEQIQEVQRVLDLSKEVNFASASHRIEEGSYPLLDNAANIIRENDQYIKMIQIHGHTDSVGNAEKNQQLSENRAKAIADYFIEKGIDAEKLSWKGFGESQLKINPEITKEDRAANRRVEFKAIAVEQDNE